MKKIMGPIELLSVTREQIDEVTESGMLRTIDAKKLGSHLAGRDEGSMWYARVVFSEAASNRYEARRLSDHLDENERYARSAFAATVRAGGSPEAYIGLTLETMKGDRFAGPVTSICPETVTVFADDGRGESQTLRFEEIATCGHYNRKDEGIMRVQYARTCDELRELFKKNGIDIWQTMDEIGRRVLEFGIECDDQSDEPVYWTALVKRMRTEELDAKDRLSATPFFKADDAETVNAYVLWPDTGLPWSMLPQPTSMTRGEFNTYVENIKALRVEGHRGVQ